jgi:hypothetical protein
MKNIFWIVPVLSQPKHGEWNRPKKDLPWAIREIFIVS